MLARLHRMMPAPEPVVAVMPRRGHDGSLGVPVWVGPLHEPADRACVVDWLRRGGPAAGPLPPRLRRRVIARPR